MSDTLLQGQRGRELTVYHTGESLVKSKRWQLLIGNLSVVNAAKAGLLPVYAWTGLQCAEVIDWAEGRSDERPLPKVLADYMKLVQDK